MRTIPPDVQIDPAPEDFSVPIATNGSVVSWRGSVEGLKYELGFRPSPMDPNDIAAAKENLRQGAWQIKEFVRIGRLDLATYALQSRHTSRGK